MYFRFGSLNSLRHLRPIRFEQGFARSVILRKLSSAVNASRSAARSPFDFES